MIIRNVGKTAALLRDENAAGQRGVVAHDRPDPTRLQDPDDHEHRTSKIQGL
jgi:hypothetical protein